MTEIMDSNYSNYIYLLQVLSIMAKKKSQGIRDHALEVFRAHGGVLRTSEAITAGIHPRILYELRDSGQVEQLWCPLHEQDLQEYRFQAIHESSF